jgi:hypothetical protein
MMTMFGMSDIRNLCNYRPRPNLCEYLFFLRHFTQLFHIFCEYYLRNLIKFPCVKSACVSQRI